MCKENVIIARTGYDKDGHTVYVRLGNSTETVYAYEDVEYEYDRNGSMEKDLNKGIS